MGGYARRGRQTQGCRHARASTRSWASNVGGRGGGERKGRPPREEQCGHTEGRESGDGVNSGAQDQHAVQVLQAPALLFCPEQKTIGMGAVVGGRERLHREGRGADPTRLLPE